MLKTSWEDALDTTGLCVGMRMRKIQTWKLLEKESSSRGNSNNKNLTEVPYSVQLL